MMPYRRYIGLFGNDTIVPWWFFLFFSGVVFVSCNYLFSESSNISFWQNTPSTFLASPFLLLGIILFSKEKYHSQLSERESNLKAIRKMPWCDFEILVSEAFRRDGFYVEAKENSDSNSQVDLTLWKNNQTIIVQCKRWDMNKIDAQAIKQLYNCIHKENADACLFITSGKYTQAAKSFAKDKPIALANGKALLELVDSVKNDKNFEVFKYLKRASLETFESSYY